MSLKQWIDDNSQEIIVLLTLAVVTIVPWNIALRVQQNKLKEIITVAPMCQEVIEKSLVKDQIIGAYKIKDKLIQKVLSNNEEIVNNLDIMVKGLEFIVEEQTQMLDNKDKQIKLLKGE